VYLMRESRSKFAETLSGLREVVTIFFLLSGWLKSFLGLVGALDVALVMCLATEIGIFGAKLDLTDSKP